MKITIGAYDAQNHTVPVTFEQGLVVHKREVNACLDEQGAYDQLTTQARVADVGRGVAVKISVGVSG